MRFLPAVIFALATLGGCIPTQPQDTPVPAIELTERSTGAVYWLYKPSYYDPSRTWPLVVTLHGTHGWDSADWQMREWKHLAEEKGLIVVAPELRSPQGILPVITSLWMADLERDERDTLAVIDEVCRTTQVDPKAILLTGFSAGGYPLYYIGLRNPQRFNMLIARSCNCDSRIFDHVQVTDALKQLPIEVFCGKDEAGIFGRSPIVSQSWAAFEFLRKSGCKKASHHEVAGGHLRRPDLAYKYWLKYLSPEHYRD